jgi:hypothetical protein
MRKTLLFSVFWVFCFSPFSALAGSDVLFEMDNPLTSEGWSGKKIPITMDTTTSMPAARVPQAPRLMLSSIQTRLLTVLLRQPLPVLTRFTSVG